MKRNCLDRAQKRQLEDYIAASKDVIEKNKMTLREVAENANGAVGFPVSWCNVLAAGKTMGVRIRYKRWGVKDRDSRPGNVAMIARSLAAFMAKLGEPIPPELAAYIASKESK